MDEPHVVGDWGKICILGSGGFGTVSLWRNTKTLECLAIKKCKWNLPNHIPPKQKERWRNEVEIMNKIDHDSIVKTKRIPEGLHKELLKYNPSQLPLLTMEYCSKGNLRHVLKQQSNMFGLPESEVRLFLKDLSSAISYLHGLNITHRDIKPENIVLQDCDYRCNKVLYKIIDLGYAKELGSTVVSFVGTLLYLAPEMYRTIKYTRSVDFWSFGIVVCEVMCGKYPFLDYLLPEKRLEHLEKKTDADIFFTTSAGDVKYSSEVSNENHLSPVLKRSLERWLQHSLIFDSTKRAVGIDVMQELNHLLNKKIIRVFSVYNFKVFYYEVQDGTLLTTLKGWLEADTNILVKEQLLLTEIFYYEEKEDRTVLQCLDEFTSDSLLILFKMNEFVSKNEIINLPVFVRHLLTSGDKEYVWNVLYDRISRATHYISNEIELLTFLKRSLATLSDHIETIYKWESTRFADLQEIATKLLTEVEFSRKVKTKLREEGVLNSLNAVAVKHSRQLLWKSRELVENVNGLTFRRCKLPAKRKVLQENYEHVRDSLDEKDLDALSHRAKQCLLIEKYKSGSIKARDINMILSEMIKIRSGITKDTTSLEYLSSAFKILRELKKLMKWMVNLDEQIDLVSNQYCASFKESICKAVYHENRAEEADLLETTNNLVSEHECLRLNLIDLQRELTEYLCICKSSLDADSDIACFKVTSV